MKHQFTLQNMSSSRLLPTNQHDHRRQHVRLFSSNGSHQNGGGRDDGEDLMAEWEMDNSTKSPSLLTHLDESGNDRV
jgi:hypothetical protein